MKRISISLVVTVLNERSSIVSLLDGIAQQTILPQETLIVDGGSQDGTYSFLLSQIPKYRLIGLQVLQHEGNRSVGRNAGIQAAKNDWIAITDAGCIPDQNWLSNLKSCLIDRSLTSVFPAGIVVAGYYDAKPTTAFEAAVVPYVLVMPDKVNATDFLPATRSLLLNRWVWQELDGFDESLSDNEDYDFARRLQKKVTLVNQSGYEAPIEIIFAKDAKVMWIPRKDIQSFTWMIYRFARGDAQAGWWRPKVLAIFMRYVVYAALCLTGLSFPVIGWLSILLAIVYVAWAIYKNARYANAGWYWLPILQIASDLAIMAGSVSGLVKSKKVR